MPGPAWATLSECLAPHFLPREVKGSCPSLTAAQGAGRGRDIWAGCRYCGPT